MGQIKKGSLWFISRCYFPWQYHTQRCTHFKIYIYIFFSSALSMSGCQQVFFKGASREDGRRLDLKNLYAALPPAWMKCMSFRGVKRVRSRGDFRWIRCWPTKRKKGAFRMIYHVADSAGGGIPSASTDLLGMIIVGPGSRLRFCACYV